MLRFDAVQQAIQIITGVSDVRLSGRTAGHDRLPPVAAVVRKRQPSRLRQAGGGLAPTGGLTRTGQGARPRGGLLLPLLLLPLLLGLVQGCAAVRVGYEKLPFLAQWEADRYFDLDAAQEALVEREVTALQAWHRGEELGRLRETLREAIQQAEAGPGADFSVARVRRWHDAVFAGWPPVAERLAPGLVELAGSLKPAQLDRFERELGAANRKLEREFLTGSDAARREARVRRWRERMEHFVGELDERQVASLQEHSKLVGIRPEDSDWWVLRRARQQELVRLLRQLAGATLAPGQALAEARRSLSGLLEPTDGPQAARAREAASARVAFLSELLQHTTPRQRDHLAQRLRGYVGDIDRLRATSSAR